MISIREPTISDGAEFIAAMSSSRELHHPWVQAPTTQSAFSAYLQHYQQENQRSFLVCNDQGAIVGVINLNEIIRGSFQNAYLGFYAVAAYAGKGYMSSGLKLVIKQAFLQLNLHRLEANIQPNNIPSINLVRANHFSKEGFSRNYLRINGQWRDHERWALTVEMMEN